MPRPRYRLTYWPIAFRGCFVSYLFAYCDVPLDIRDDLEEILDLKDRPLEDRVTPWIGPPLLEDFETGEALSQAPAIVLRVSPELGLMPRDPARQARCMKIQMDCNDVLMEICRYNGSFMWSREAWIDFRQNRLPRWMSVFERELTLGSLGHQEVSFADLATVALFGNMVRCLTDLEPDLRAHAPGIAALCDRLEAHPPLARYIAVEQERYGGTYCGGQIEHSIRQQLKLDREGGDGQGSL